MPLGIRECSMVGLDRDARYEKGSESLFRIFDCISDCSYVPSGSSVVQPSVGNSVTPLAICIDDENR